MKFIKSETGLNTPLNQPIANSKGELTQGWYAYFQALFDRIGNLSQERYFSLENDVTTAKDIKGMQFDSKKLNQIFIDYLIQRVTKGVGGSELIEAGTLRIVYKPKAKEWTIAKLAGSGPDTGGITFSITSSGQVQYTSTNMAGTIDATTPQKITWRSRSIFALLPSTYF